MWKELQSSSNPKLIPKVAFVLLTGQAIQHLSIKQKNRLSVKLNRFVYAKRRPTLTGGNPQLPSALKSLTAVFGMGTGVTSLPSSLHIVT